jgi:thiol-disulfide isomerase/thioredoxin
MVNILRSTHGYLTSDPRNYSHRCAHCKSLEPVMSEVGKHYLEDPNFVVYRIDGTKNDIVHPRVRVVGYPTLYFFPGADKLNPSEYDGNRTVEAIVGFVQAFRTAYHSEEDHEPAVDLSQGQGNLDTGAGTLNEDLQDGATEGRGGIEGGDVVGGDSREVEVTADGDVQQV